MPVMCAGHTRPQATGKKGQNARIILLLLWHIIYVVAKRQWHLSSIVSLLSSLFGVSSYVQLCFAPHLSHFFFGPLREHAESAFSVHPRVQRTELDFGTVTAGIVMYRDVAVVCFFGYHSRVYTTHNQTR